MTSSSEEPSGGRAQRPGPRRPADVYAEFGGGVRGPSEPVTEPAEPTEPAGPVPSADPVVDPDAAAAGVDEPKPAEDAPDDTPEDALDVDPPDLHALDVDPPDLHPPAAGDTPPPAPAAGPTGPPPEPRAAKADPDAKGDFTPYTIGDPGRAFARTVPLPSTAPGGVHDYAMDAATISDADGTPRLVLRGASGRGLAHQQYGDPRQDDYGFALSADGNFLVGVVADGVSAGKWSHLAARLAAEEGSAHVANLLATTDAVDIDWRGVLVMLSERMQDLCATLPSRDPRDVELTPREIAEKMATTIIFGVVGVRPEEDGTHPVTVVRLGDTSGWILDAEDGWVALGDVKNEGNLIAESATACLPLVPEGDPLVVQTTLGAGAALLLLTDGIGDPLGSGKGEVGAVLAKQWASPPHPIEFAGQVCFGRKTFDDDRGAIGIWPVSAASS